MGDKKAEVREYRRGRNARTKKLGFVPEPGVGSARRSASWTQRPDSLRQAGGPLVKTMLSHTSISHLPMSGADCLRMPSARRLPRCG